MLQVFCTEEYYFKINIKIKKCVPNKTLALSFSADVLSFFPRNVVFTAKSKQF